MTLDEIAKCRTNLLTYYKTIYTAMYGDFQHNWHMNIVCEALMRVVIGEIKRLIINIPPRACKTEMAVITFISWCLGNYPDSQFIMASNTKTLAEQNNYLTRAVLTHPIYKDIFSHAELKKDAKSKDFFKTAQGGACFAVGTEGLVAGFGAGKLRDYFGGAVIIDDPHNPNESLSKTQRHKVIDWYNFNVTKRLNNQNATPVILIMQRLHPEDLTGYLLEKQGGFKWHHISIPIWDENEKLLWPIRYNYDELKDEERSNPFVFAGQRLQKPIVPGGNLIKTDQFGFYSVLPKIKSKMMYADTAQKTKEHNDYSVIECWGEGFDGCIYLLDLIRGKWEAPELTRRAVAFWEKHLSERPKVRQFKIEDKVSGTGLIQELKRNYRIPVKGMERSKDKYERWLDVAGQIEAGFVKLPQSAPWLSDFLSECEAFTADNTHAHDDQVDPMIDAITDMLGAKNKTKVWERLL